MSEALRLRRVKMLTPQELPGRLGRVIKSIGCWALLELKPGSPVAGRFGDIAMMELRHLTDWSLLRMIQPLDVLAAHGLLSEPVIRKYDCHHGFAHDDKARQQAWIVAAYD